MGIHNALIPTVLASVAISREYIPTPLFIFIAAAIYSGFAVAFIAWMLFTALEVWSAFPFRRFGSMLNSDDARRPFFRISPHRIDSAPRLLGFDFGRVKAFKTAKPLLVGARRYAEFLAALQAILNDWWIFAFNRAIALVSMIDLIWTCFKGFAASFADDLKTRSLVITAQLVTAFTGARSLPTMFEATRISEILFGANRTSSFNHEGYFTA